MITGIRFYVPYAESKNLKNTPHLNVTAQKEVHSTHGQEHMIPVTVPAQGIHNFS